MSPVTGCLYNSNAHHHKYAENELSGTLFVGIQWNSVLAPPLVNSSFSEVVNFLFPLAIAHINFKRNLKLLPVCVEWQKIVALALASNMLSSYPSPCISDTNVVLMLTFSLRDRVQLIRISRACPASSLSSRLLSSCSRRMYSTDSFSIVPLLCRTLLNNQRWNTHLHLQNYAYSLHDVWIIFVSELQFVSTLIYAPKWQNHVFIVLERAVIYLVLLYVHGRTSEAIYVLYLRALEYIQMLTIVIERNKCSFYGVANTVIL